MRGAALCAGLASLALASAAWAEPPPAPGPPPVQPSFQPPVQQPPVQPAPPAPPVRPAPARRPPPPPRPAAPPLPPPAVHLSLDVPTTRGPWTLHVTNDGDVPVMLAADARLVWLEVTGRSERKPVRCELPADLRPGDNLDRSLVLPPGRAYVEAFEPRLYCFGDRENDALTPTATVVAHLGWEKATKDLTRVAVAPLDGVLPAVAPQASLASPPVALPDDPTPWAEPPAEEAAPRAEVPRLRLTSSRAVDAMSWGTVPITVTLHNDGARPVRVRFRPETLGFDVSGPSGTVRCGWPGRPSAPTPELFDTVAPGRSASIGVVLDAYCARSTFGRPGLLIVRAELDTRQAGGIELGLTTFDGEAIATQPTVVRLHHGSGDDRRRRPHLADSR